MKCRFGLLLIAVAVGLFTLLAAETELNDYGVSDDSVVATPIGYEKRDTLDTGETVRMYPDQLSPEAVTNCRAVLFCILSPDNLRGKYFLLNHSGCDCYMHRPLDSMTNLYQIGRHYIFYNYNSGSSDLYPLPAPTTDVKRIAFELGVPDGPFQMQQNWGEILFCNTRDTEKRIRELEVWAQDCTNKINKLKNELSQLPTPEQLAGDEAELIKNKRHRIQLKSQIRSLNMDVSNGIPYRIQSMMKRRDWLQAQGGAVTNRIEPDRMCWDEEVRKLADYQLTAVSYNGVTITDILADIERITEANDIHWRYTPINIRGCPRDVTWSRKYDLEFPKGSIQDLLLKIGTLPEVSMRVARKYDSWEVFYSVPGNSPHADWSSSAFSTVCEQLELKDVTVYEAMSDLYDIRDAHSGNCGLHTRKVLNGDARRSFSFSGKTIRESISEIEQAFGVVYDYSSDTLFDPRVPPVLEDLVKLQKCDRSVWGGDRVVRQEDILGAEQVKMLNGMLERCDVVSNNFVCCEYFLQNGKYFFSVNTIGILVDDAKEEALGFDLGSGYQNAKESDSRQRHFVRIIQRKEDRRALYSFLSSLPYRNNGN